jgi:hypothetical protein
MKRGLGLAFAASLAFGAGALVAQDIGGPQIFEPITPCRVVDTRQVNGGPGGPVTNVVMTLDITGAAYSGVPAGANPCTVANGAPTGATSVAVNFTMANVAGPADLRVAPGGGTPTSSVMNSAGPNLANAIVVPVNGGGQLAVKSGGANFNLIVDVFGYYIQQQRNGNYLETHADTTNNSYVLYGVNPALTSCSSTCGLYMETDSTLGNTTATFWNNDTGTEVNTGIMGTVNSTGANSAGVLGIATGTTGFVKGVAGTSASPGGAGVFGDATATGFSAASGVYGRSEGGFGGSGIYGLANCGGLCYGVFGDVGNGTLYGVYSFGAAYVSGDLTVSGAIFAGTKDFIAPYPGDASKEIRYTSAEAPEALAFVRGKAQVVNGFATISLPDHFRLSVDPDSMTVNLTPIGGMATVGVVRLDPDKVVIQASRDMRVDYVVYGERSAFRGQQAVAENTHFRPMYEGRPVENWPASYVEIMKQNGVLNADGSANKATYERLGWTLLPQESNPAVRSEKARAAEPKIREEEHRQRDLDNQKRERARAAHAAQTK